MDHTGGESESFYLLFSSLYPGPLTSLRSEEGPRAQIPDTQVQREGGSILQKNRANRAGRSRSEPRKNPFSNFKISRKNYSLEKQLQINHTAGSILPIAFL